MSCRRSGGNNLPEQSHYALSGSGDTLSWYDEDTVSRPANTLSRGGDNLCDRPDDLPGIPDSLSRGRHGLSAGLHRVSEIAHKVSDLVVNRGLPLSDILPAAADNLFVDAGRDDLSGSTHGMSE